MLFSISICYYHYDQVLPSGGLYHHLWKAVQASSCLYSHENHHVDQMHSTQRYLLK